MFRSGIRRLVNTNVFLHNRKWDWRVQLQLRSLNTVIQPEPVESQGSLEGQAVYEELVQRYNTLVQTALEGGGPKGIERHVKKNKKVLVRDRIRMLIDPGTEFFELGTLAGFSLAYGDIPAAGTVSGIGRVAGIYCVIGANDATVKAGAYYPITVQKSLRMQEISEVNRLPSIYVPDSAGAFLPLQSLIFIYGGRTFFNQAVMSSKGIPQIAVVCGSCTAGAAYNPTMSDEAIIVDGIGKIFLGGPPLVQAALQEIVTEEELGGGFLHSSVSGCTDYFARNEEEAFHMCRDIVESLNFQSFVAPSSFDEPNHMPSWNQIGSRKHLNKVEIYTLLASILDQSRFKEFKAFYGPGLITGIGYIEGFLLGIITNSNCILSSEALKGVHFLDMCGRRGIPVLFLQNSSPDEDKDSMNCDSLVLKNRGQLTSAVATLNVPKISLTLTACDKEDILLLCGPAFSPNFSYMWPAATISAPDMVIADRKSEETGIIDAFDAAANMIIDNVILPENTRTVIGQTLRILNQTKLNKGSTDSTNRPIFRM